MKALMHKFEEIGFYDDDGAIWWVKREDIGGLSLQELLLDFKYAIK